MGDGFLPTFDGPARAVRCALAIVEAVRGVGVEPGPGSYTADTQGSAAAMAHQGAMDRLTYVDAVAGA